MLKSLSVVVLASLALACSSEGPRLRVATEGTSFERTSAAATYNYANVPFDVRNVGEASAWIPACGQMVSVAVQRWEDDRWAAHGGTICIAVLPMDPIVLRSGQTTSSSFRIQEPGHFRFAVSYAAGAEERQDARWSYSNAFDVH